MAAAKGGKNLMKLVFLRHGQSQWNLENRFTGWHDVPLSAEGLEEAIAAGKALKREKFVFDVSYTSVLRRAILTHFHVLDQLDQLHVPVTRSWRLNERHYGALTGLNKEETAKKHGAEKVKLWRRSYDVGPPKMDSDNPYSNKEELKYKNIAKAMIPMGESLKDTVERTAPFLYDHILQSILERKDVLVVAHGNSIRSIMKIMEGISDDKIVDLNLTTGLPYVYEMDDNLQIKNKYTVDVHPVGRER